MEHAWRVFTYPKRYSFKEAIEAAELIKKIENKLEPAIEHYVEGVDPEDLNKIFLGLYHHSITLPPDPGDNTVWN